MDPDKVQEWEENCKVWETWEANDIAKEFEAHLSLMRNYLVYLWKYQRIEISKYSKLLLEYMDIHQATRFYNEHKEDYQSCRTRAILYHQTQQLNQASASLNSSTENLTLLTFDSTSLSRKGSGEKSSEVDELKTLMVGMATNIHNLTTSLTLVGNLVKDQQLMQGVKSRVDEQQQVQDLKARSSKERFSLDDDKPNIRFKVIVKIKRAFETEDFFLLASSLNDVALRLAHRSRGVLQEFLQIEFDAYSAIIHLPTAFNEQFGRQMIFILFNKFIACTAAATAKLEVLSFYPNETLKQFLTRTVLTKEILDFYFSPDSLIRYK